MRILFLIILSILCSSVLAQTNGIFFEKITLDDGLSQSHINCIAQDQKGFIWFGTNGGLNRYDGSSFKIFVHDHYDSLSLSNNIINCLLVTGNGNIWVGTQNGLNYYDRYKDRFYSFKSVSLDPYSITSNTITSLAEDSVGNIWIGTDGGGLNMYDTANHRFFNYQHLIQNTASLSSNRISSISIDRFGFIWVGTFDRGLNQFDPKLSKSLRYFANPDLPRNGLTSNTITDLFHDQSGDLLVATDKGLNIIKLSKNGRSLDKRDPIKQYRYCAGSNKGITHLTSIYQGASGLIWLGTDRNGLSSFSKKSKKFRNYNYYTNRAGSLLSNKVNAVFDDKAAILWIGTNAGINKIDRQKDRFNLIKRNPLESNTLSSNNIQAIYKERNGTTWIGTFDGGLNKFDPGTGVFTVYTTDDLIIDGLSRKALYRKNKKRARQLKKRYLNHNRVLSIHRDLLKTLWIGTGGGGLNKLSLSTGKFTYYKAADHPDSLSGNIVRTIFEDSKGAIWIGTEDGGLNKFNRFKFTRFLNNQDDLLSLSDNHVRAITEDEEGTIWVGTFGGGLNKYDEKTKTFKRYIHEENSSNTISSNVVYCLYSDDERGLWIGTSDGLNLLRKNSGKFEHYTINDGLPSSSVYKIFKDNEKNIWVSTSKGISRFNPEKKRFKNYDKLDGLQGNEFNAGSGFQGRNDEILIGGLYGLNSFYPKNIVDNTFIPDVVITDFKILNNKVEIGATGSPLDVHISEADQINLSYTDKAISFEFVALNFTKSEKNQYAYIMENFESEWNYVGSRRFANYTNLPPGEYIFRVKASNNDDVWNNDGTSIKIEVSGPVWQSWWFLFLLLIFIGSSAYLIMQWRIRSLRKTKAQLRLEVVARTEQLVNEKARVEKAHSEILIQKNEIENQKNLLMRKNKELTDAKSQLDGANDELVKINNNLESIIDERTAKLRQTNDVLVNTNVELDSFIYRASHDLKGPIARLLGLTMVAKLDEAEKEFANQIELEALSLNRTLNKHLDIHSIYRDDLKVEKINLTEFTEEIFKQKYLKELSPKGLRLKSFMVDNLEIECDSSLLRIIFDNIVENSLIFTIKTNPSIIVIARKTDKEIVIEIEDDGIGMSEEIINRSTEMFYRGSDRSRGNGLGLYLVKKAAQRLSGDIVIESMPEEFTKVTINLPVLSKEEYQLYKKVSVSSNQND